MVAATLEGTLSGLGRAMVQRGLLPERDAEATLSQAKTAGVGFVEQLILGKKLKGADIAEKRIPRDGRMKLVLSRNRAIDVAEQAQREGIHDLRQSGLLKVRQGMTSLEEIEAVTNE
jgi:type II secretory ATPase GspE/PulE/Tfp pilus assembly ATPase PilB-like protein